MTNSNALWNHCTGIIKWSSFEVSKQKFYVAHVHTHVHQWADMLTHMHTYAGMYTHMYTCMYTHMHTHLHTHAHTYTHFKILLVKPQFSSSDPSLQSFLPSHLSDTKLVHPPLSHG